MPLHPIAKVSFKQTQQVILIYNFVFPFSLSWLKVNEIHIALHQHNLFKLTLFFST